MTTDTETLQQTLGAALDAERRRQGWTQQQLADATGMTQGTVGRLLNCEATMSVPRLEAICRALKPRINVGEKMVRALRLPVDNAD